MNVIRLGQALAYSDSPSALVLETVIVQLGKRPSYSTIKSGLRLLADYVAAEVVIPRPCSMYDCTGKSFTSSIDRLNRSIHKGVPHDSPTGIEEYLLIGTYHHHVSVDV